MSKIVLGKNRKSIIAYICIFCLMFGMMQPGIDVNAQEVPDSSLKTISFGHFGIESKTYTPTGDLNATGSYLTSLNGTIFSANLIFNGTAGVDIRFGGSYWSGLVLAADGTGLSLSDALGNIAPATYAFSSETAGTTLIGAEFNLKISTQFVDSDTDGLTDDVKLGIWFNDVLYNQSYIYLTDYAPLMGRMISVFVQGTDHSLTIVPQQVINPIQPDTTLRKISFKNFGIADADLLHNGDLVFTGDYSGSLDGTLFTGNVTFSGSSNMDIRVGGSTNYWYGLRFYKIGNNFFMSDVLGNTAEYVFLPLIAKTSFSDVKFNLKLSFQFVDSDTDGVKDDVKLGVWFNDNLYENSFIFLTNYAPNLGKKISGFIDSATTPSSVLSVQSDVSGARKSPDPYLTNITFRHFGVADATHSYTGDLNALGTYPSSLDKTMFSGDVTFSGTASSDIRFGGTSAWYGLQLYKSGSMLYMSDVAGNTGVYGFTASMAGTNLVDAKFNLKISTQFVDSDVDGVKDDVKLGIWFNNILYENNYIYLTNYAPNMGSRLDLFVQALGGSIAVASKNPETMQVPDPTLRTITFNNYGIADNTFTTTPDGDLNTSGKHLGTLDGTLFSGNVTFGGNGTTEIRFGGATAAWTGLLFKTKTDSNNLFMQDAEALTSEYTFVPTTAGAQLVGHSTNLKISIQFIDYDDDGLKDDVQLGVWFNGVLYDANYIYLTNYAVKLGEYLGIRVLTSGSSLVVNSSAQGDIKTPYAGLKNITFSDFNIVDGTYDYTGDLNSYGSYGESLNGTLFSGDVTFGGNGVADIRFGGVATYWNGLRFYTLNNNLYMEDVQGKTAVYGFSSVMAGTSFIGEEFNLQITTQFVDSDLDGSTDDVKMGVWFNGVLYENNYIYLTDYAPYMGKQMGIFVHAAGTSISISSTSFVTLVGPDSSLTDITFSNFGIANSTFEQGNLSASGQYVGTLDGTLFSGNVTFVGNGVNLFIGGMSSAQTGLQFYSVGNNLYMKNATNLTAEYTFVPSKARTNLVGKNISLNISVQFVDSDSDGQKDDVKLGVWFNGILYENKYIYLTNYTSTLGSKMGIDIPSGQNASLMIQSNVISEADAIYNLDDGNYLATGSGIIFINGNFSLAGAEISLPGEYKIIRYEDSSQYTQNVVLYIRGDINCDNKKSIGDLLELKKYLLTDSMKYVKAGKEAADLNGDRTVNLLDMVKFKRIILKIDSLGILPAKLTFSTAGGKDVMPISGYYGPYANTYVSPTGWVTPDYLTDYYFQLIHDCGINVINYTPNNYNSGGDTVASIRKGLELGEKYGIGMYVLDNGINNSMSTAEIASRIGNYSVFNSFLGIFIIDEPGTSTYASGSLQLSEFSSLTSRLNQYVNLMGYINLYPLSDTLGTAAQYETYLEEYCSTTDAKMLSYDHYVFDAGSANTAASYFMNLSMARDAALEHNIPLWAYVQAGGNWRDSGSNADTGRYYPTENELLWNVNTLLAFGAKGIQYFPLIQPYYFANATTTEFDFDRNGLIAADGSKTEWYSYAQKANAQIAAVDEILLRSTSKGIIAKGYYAQQNTQNLSGMITSYEELSSVSVETAENIPYLGYGAIVGCFDYNGKTALYVVNYNTSSSKTITLNFNNSYNFTVINSSGSTAASGSTYSINSLEAGRAVLLVIE